MEKKKRASIVLTLLRPVEEVRGRDIYGMRKSLKFPLLPFPKSPPVTSMAANNTYTFIIP